MKSYRECSIAPRINLGTRCRWVIILTLRPLHPRTHWTDGTADPRAGPDGVAKKTFSVSVWNLTPVVQSGNLIITLTEGVKNNIKSDNKLRISQYIIRIKDTRQFKTSSCCRHFMLSSGGTWR
jgi:hypothetical protein